ncbi:MAG: lipopolysaccharide heptosyltransferase I [Pseudomonadales bacterium]
MKVLIIKMSSLGDVLHALPAVTDALNKRADIHFHWLVEEGFQDVPGMHPGIEKVIPIAIRRWRKNWIGTILSGELGEFVKELRSEHYDLVIDAQGLIKSAMVGMIARGPVSGFDRHSIREKLASVSYRESQSVAMDLHAVERQRRLFAKIFSYEISGAPDFGLSGDYSQDHSSQDSSLQETASKNNGLHLAKSSGHAGGRIMLLHGTTWESKLWPESYWAQLSSLAQDRGFDVLIPAGNEIESARAHHIAEDSRATVLEGADLRELAAVMAQCSGVVSVDTGLGHMAVALDLPLVAIYGSTDPGLTGVYGERQKVIVSDHLPCIPCRKRICRYAIEDYSSKIYPPCYQPITPELVWQALQFQISQSNKNSNTQSN